MINIGDKVPNFSLPSDNGSTIDSASYLGKKNIVLYFYPKDATPGCTQEACDFRDNIARIQSSDTEVLGISKDSVASHKKFKEKYSLPFPLLSDEDKTVHEIFGTWAPKKFMGREFLGTVRSTFLIDKDGVLRNEWRNVSVKGHVDAVAEAIQKL